MIPGIVAAAGSRGAASLSLSAAAGAYVVAGQAAGLTHQIAGQYEMTGLPGSYTATGASADLITARLLAGSAGAYGVTGYESYVGRGVVAECGSYTVAGVDANLVYNTGSSDPHWANVVLLVGADTALVDESSFARTLTADTGVTRSTSSPIVGAGSIQMPASDTGRGLRAADSNDFSFGAAAFTLEAKVQFSSDTTNSGILGQWSGSSSSDTGVALYLAAGVLKARFYNVTTAHEAIYSFSPVSGQTYSIAMDRDGSGNLRLYIDGAMVAKATGKSHTVNNSSQTFNIGYLNNGSGQHRGQIDEVRVTNGTARYASDAGYTPLSGAFPRG